MKPGQSASETPMVEARSDWISRTHTPDEPYLKLRAGMAQPFAEVRVPTLL